MISTNIDTRVVLQFLISKFQVLQANIAMSHFWSFEFTASVFFTCIYFIYLFYNIKYNKLLAQQYNYE